MNTEGRGLEGVELSDEQLKKTVEMAAMLPTRDQAISMNYPGIQTVYQAICEGFPEAEVRYAKGCDVSSPDKTGFDESVKLAGECDISILVLGGKNGSGTGCTMGENVDSSDIGLPGVQEELAMAVAGAGKPVILVHMDGRPLSSAWAKDNAAAILEVWHPSQCGPKVIADILNGSLNPGGKLPVTVVRNSGQVPLYMDQRRGSGALYRGMLNSDVSEGYFNESGLPLYPFGFGLSYSRFEVDSLMLSSNEMEPDSNIRISCKVKNNGDIAGDEVVQLYFSDQISSIARPHKELAGFKRVHLQPGEEKDVSFVFHASQTAFLGLDMKWRIEAGKFDIMVGNSSDNLNLKAELTIKNTKISESSKRVFYCDVEVK